MGVCKPTRGHFYLSGTFYGMKIGPFLAEIEPKTLKKTHIGLRVVGGGGGYWKGAFIGCFTVCEYLSIGVM